MVKNILAVGYLQNYIEGILNISKDIKLIVIEEPSLIPSSIIDNVVIIPGRYQQSDEALNVAKEIDEKYNFCAVVPLREYAVPCVNDIANELNLKKVGKTASVCFRDKFQLRSYLQHKKINNFKQPEFSRVETIEDVYDFYRNHGACIIKPSNKQATVGVFKILTKEDIALAYIESTEASEPGRTATDRALNWDYQVEELVEGNEYSTEVFVKDSRITFYNATKKTTFHGNIPLETGHMLPVSIFDAQTDKLLSDAISELSKIFEVENAVLHAEWMVNESGVYLIECAARTPGGCITELISTSYSIDYFKEYINILSDSIASEKHSYKPKIISAIGQFLPINGIVCKVHKTAEFAKELLEENITIVSYVNNFSLGDSVKINNNQGRKGYVILKGNSQNSIEKSIEKICNEAVLTR